MLRSFKLNRLFYLDCEGLTQRAELVEVLVLEGLRVAAELRAPFSGGHLEVVPLDPLGDPGHLAVARQEPASNAERYEQYLLAAHRELFRQYLAEPLGVLLLNDLPIAWHNRSTNPPLVKQLPFVTTDTTISLKRFWNLSAAIRVSSFYDDRHNDIISVEFSPTNNALLRLKLRNEQLNFLKSFPV